MSTSGKSSAYRGVTLFRPTMKWRAQISADGKTTSLGDHDTEELAAVAFDRACINKSGKDAKTNFPLSNYANEVEDLRGMTQVELVAMLRSMARKTGQQTSHFRGVSLLRQTNKWHAQINVGGKQVHLGFFPTEEFAARAYDRAAINKGSKEVNKGKLITNFDISDYSEELDLLRRISQEDLIEALSNEGKRKAGEATPTTTTPTALFAKARTGSGKMAPQTKSMTAKDKAELEALCAKAERAQPKSTARNPLYLDFGKKKTSKKEEASPLKALPSPPSSPPPQATKIGRLFSGASLPSLEGGRALALPLIDQVTGAPAAVMSMPYPSVPLALPAATKMTASRAKAPQNRTASPRTTKPAKGRPPLRLTATTGQKETRPEAGKETAHESPEELSQPFMPAPPESAPKVSTVPMPVPMDPKERFGASAYARYAKFLAPMMNLVQPPVAQPSPPVAAPKRKKSAPKAPSAAEAEASPIRTGKRPSAAPAAPENKSPQAAEVKLPPTPPPKRQRTSLRRAAYLGQSKEAGSLDALAEAADDVSTRAPVRTLQERLRQQQAEHKRQQAEQRALVSEVIDHLMARPLTKRQEALAAKKHEEAAATLASARQQSPLPDEVGDALMDFAAAAELAELEDQAHEQQAVRAEGRGAVPKGDKRRTSRTATRGRAASEAATQDTVTDSDTAQGDGNAGVEISSERHLPPIPELPLS